MDSLGLEILLVLCAGGWGATEIKVRQFKAKYYDVLAERDRLRVQLDKLQKEDSK